MIGILQKIQVLNQQAEILTNELKSKDAIIEEKLQDIQKMKYALRRSSSLKSERSHGQLFAPLEDDCDDERLF